jgi:hypothetical protein
VILVTVALIAQIALGVIIGGLTIVLFVVGFVVWDKVAVGLFIAGAVIVVVLVVIVVLASHQKT